MRKDESAGREREKERKRNRVMNTSDVFPIPERQIDRREEKRREAEEGIIEDNKCHTDVITPPTRQLRNDPFP